MADEMQGPKDEYLHHYVASKVEARKIYQSSRFEEITAKFWQLLRQDKLADASKVTISKAQYVGFMKRVYRVLLALYRPDEMEKEIAEEWLIDSSGTQELTLHLFTKLLFRIVHQWATHIDLDEYVEFLEKLFTRITIRKAVRAKDKQEILCYPTIITEIVPETNDGEDPWAPNTNTTESALWDPCLSDEEEKPGYDYQFKEDEPSMTVRKHKKRTPPPNPAADEEGMGDQPPAFHVKEALDFRETPVYYQNSGDYKPHSNDMVTYVLAEEHDILPFGYPAEQFLSWLKNDVYSKVEQSKKEKKEAIVRMRKEAQSKNGIIDDTRGIQRERDQGVVKALGNYLELPYDLITNTSKTRTRAKVKIVDLLYNSMRAAIKDISQISLRQEMLHPRPQIRSGQVQRKGSVGGTEPSTEINKFGYNPALSRRIKFKLVPIFSKKGKPEYININFMYQHQDYEAAYRCDVEKTENSNKLAIKPSDEVRNDYDFIPCETSFKKMRQIMLSKKFETIYTDVLQGDENDLRRIDKLVDKEEIRKRKCRLQESLSTKAVSETFEEKHIIKAMMGPFFKSISKEGLKEDDFVTCAQQDLIDFASKPAQKILLLGKPRSGKTTLAKLLCQRLDLVHINVENWMTKLLQKVQKHKEDEEENPVELEEGQEPPKWLTDLEESVYNKLLDGTGSSHQENLAILKEEMQSPMALTKGYVLDLNFYKGIGYWKDIIRNEKLIGPTEGNGTVAEFSHIIELELEDEEIKLRAKHMLMDGTDGVVYSGYEIKERNKPKPVQLDEDGNPIEEEAGDDDENKPKPLIVSEMLKRVEDTESFLQIELDNYADEKKQQLDDFIVRLYNHQYLKIEAAGLLPEEIADSAECILRPDETIPLRPIAIQPENEASDFKALITDPMKEDMPEGTLPRTFGLWQQTDPVALFNEKVLPGQAGLGVAYANNMFAFASEENRDAFLKEPKKYLVKAPEMPKSYRVMMIGPKGIGTHTQAEKLNSQYGWTIVDYPKIVKEKLAIILKESEGITKEEHIPNNVEDGLSRIGLSWAEIEDIKQGKPCPSWKFIPWILDFLGYKLMKRPPPPEDPVEDVNPEELEGEELENYQKAQKKKEQDAEKKKKDEEELAKAKAARAEARRQQLEDGVPPEEIEESPEEKPEDLSIDDLVLRVDEGQPAPFVGGFILMGFPQTEIHMTKLKEHGIEFDRVLALADQREEDVGKEVIERMTVGDMHYDWEAEVAKVTKVLDTLKEFLGEDAEKVLDINGIGTIEEVFIRIRAAIDPFFLRVDNPDDVRTSAELDEEAKRLPKGDFGDYCPVTYIKENWLIRGSQEFEATVYGKTYWFAGEKEQEEFKFNPARFLTGFGGAKSLPLAPPPPKIMIIGNKGSGVTTQQQMLAKKFKLDTLDVREAFLDKLISEREIRKRRRLLDRGFKPPPPPEDEEEENAEIPPDPEIEEDPEEFDREQHEKDLIRMITDSSKGLIIDGTWQGGWPEQLVKDDKVLLKEFTPPASKEDGAAYAQFLIDSRRVPEIIVILRCSEENALKRMIDEEAIKKKYEELMEKRAQQFKEKRNADRAEKLKELAEALAAAEGDEEKTPEDIATLKQENEEAMVTWDKERDEEDRAADEDDPDRPNFEEMMEAERTVIRTQLEADEAFLAALVETCTEKNIQVIDNLKTDQSAEFAFVKLLDKLKDRIQMRADLIEREQVRALEPAELKFYEESYTYQQSKFGRNSPLSLFNPVKTREHAVLYRERIYYLSDLEEKDMFRAEPSKYTLGVEAIPLDVVTKPKIAILGNPMSGKSSLAASLAQDTGAVHIQLAEIIEQVVERDSVQSEKIRFQLKTEGRGLDDSHVVALLAKRLKQKDCLLNGWIIEDFPRTRQQALLMARSGINPANVFHIRVPYNEVFNRTEHLVDSDFGAHRTILAKRLRYLHVNTPQVLGFYQRIYNSLTEMDGMKSQWFLYDSAITAIEANLKARQLFSKSQCFPPNHPKGHRPSQINDLNIDRCILKSSISQFKYYCPVTWKNTKQLIKCTHNQELCVFYENMFFYFRGQAEKDMFLANPKRFTNNVIFSSSKGIPFRIALHKAAEIVSQEKAIVGHCPVSLVDEQGRVVKGDGLLSVQYKDNKFCFESEHKLQRFLVNPARYHKAQLPVKMPPHDDPVSLYALQGGIESTAFMEQALGSVVTRGLREVSENRLKHPHMSVKETMLKCFAIFLKAENPANSEYLKEKYRAKMKLFVERCEIAEELCDLKEERDKKIKKDKWPEFKDKYYHELGAKYDGVIKQTAKEKQTGFCNYMK